jgi:hypothetical protein
MAPISTTTASADRIASPHQPYVALSLEVRLFKCTRVILAFPNGFCRLVLRSSSSTATAARSSRTTSSRSGSRVSLMATGLARQPSLTPVPLSALTSQATASASGRQAATLRHS